LIPLVNSQIVRKRARHLVDEADAVKRALPPNYGNLHADVLYAIEHKLNRAFNRRAVRAPDLCALADGRAPGETG
jgi:hypothetical protein